MKWLRRPKPMLKLSGVCLMMTLMSSCAVTPSDCLFAKPIILEPGELEHLSRSTKEQLVELAMNIEEHCR